MVIWFHFPGRPRADQTVKEESGALDFRSKSEKANASISYIAFWICFRVQVLVFSCTQMFCIPAPVQCEVIGGEKPQQCLITTFKTQQQNLTWPCSSPSTEQMDAFTYCGRCHFWCVHLPKNDMLLLTWNTTTVLLSRPCCRRQPARHKLGHALFGSPEQGLRTVIVPVTALAGKATLQAANIHMF